MFSPYLDISLCVLEMNATPSMLFCVLQRESIHTGLVGNIPGCAVLFCGAWHTFQKYVPLVSLNYVYENLPVSCRSLVGSIVPFGTVSQEFNLIQLY